LVYYYSYLLSKKLKPSTKPQDQPSGNREFIRRDPDGYKLMIFKRKRRMRLFEPDKIISAYNIKLLTPNSHNQESIRS